MTFERGGTLFPPRWSLVFTWLVVVMVWAGLHGAQWYFRHGGGEEPLGMHNPDSYTRLVRVERLAETWEWWNGTEPRENPAAAARSHWTRPMDAVLLAGGVVAGWIKGDFRMGLFGWGYVLSPLLHLGCLVLLWEGAKLYGVSLLRLALVYFFQLAVFAHCAAGNPDHHSLILLVFAGVVSLGLWMIREPEGGYRPFRVLFQSLVNLRGVSFFSVGGGYCPFRLLFQKLVNLFGVLFFLIGGEWLGGLGGGYRPFRVLFQKLVNLFGVLFFLIGGEWLGGLGGVLAFGVWVSVESVVALGWAGLVFTGLYLWEGKKWAGVMKGLLLGYSVGVILFWFAEYGAWASPRETYGMDAISHTWWLPFVFALAGWAFLLEAEKKRKRTLGWRVIMVGAMGVFVLAVWLAWGMRGGSTGNPFGAVDARVQELWLARVMELRPMFERPDRGVAFLFLLTGGGLLAAGYGVWRMVYAGKLPAREAAWLVVGLAVFFVLTLRQVRWATYVQLLSVIPLTVWMEEGLRWLDERKPGPARVLARVGWMFGLVALPVLAGVALMPKPAALETPGGGALPPVRGEVPFSEMTAWMRGHLPEETTVVADVDVGPELLYRTPFAVVATPHHRNDAGILAAYDLLSARVPEGFAKAREIAQGVRGDVILVANFRKEARYYGQENGAATLYHALVTGARVPEWIREVELPERLREGGYRLYRILRVETEADPR